MEEKRFDPYDILELSIGATPSDIKRAYRKMSLKYHPDKNSDPERLNFFTESVAPAYKTLTDDVARENFEKHGHPDGRQSTKLGVALPEELFGRGRFEGLAPFVLLGMVLVTILLPLIIIVRILMKGDKYAHTGIDGKKVLRQTQSNFGQLLKPVMKLTGVPELVSVAQEFMEMEYKGDKLNESLSEVMKQCRNEIGGGELAQKFVRRKPCLVRTHSVAVDASVATRRGGAEGVDQGFRFRGEKCAEIHRSDFANVVANEWKPEGGFYCGETDAGGVGVFAAVHTSGADYVEEI